MNICNRFKSACLGIDILLYVGQSNRIRTLSVSQKTNTTKKYLMRKIFIIIYK